MWSQSGQSTTVTTDVVCCQWWSIQRVENVFLLLLLTYFSESCILILHCSSFPVFFSSRRTKLLTTMPKKTWVSFTSLIFCLCGKKFCFWNKTAQAAHIQLTRGYYHVNKADRFHWWSVQINKRKLSGLHGCLRSMHVWISTFLYKKHQYMTEDLHAKTYKHAWHIECLLRPQMSSVCSYKQGSASNSRPLSQWERTTHP